MSNSLSSFIPRNYFEVTLPVSKEIINVRKMVHGDSKGLLYAFSEYQEKQGTSSKGHAKTLLSSMADAIQNCVKESIDVKKLQIADFVYLMNYLKTISKKETYTYSFACEDENCKHVVDLDFRAEECSVKNLENYLQNIVEINFDSDTKFVLTMKEYTFEMMIINSAMFEGKITSDTLSKFYSSFIDSVEIVIPNSESIVKTSCSLNEKIDMINLFENEQLEKVINYIQGRPKLYWAKEYTCKKCNETYVAELKEVLDFF